MTAKQINTVTRRQLNVLFVCSGNSGRSIMAESILRGLGLGQFETFSAGRLPTGRINPMTIKELQRRGYPTENLSSKSWLNFASPDAPHMDYIVTVCEAIANEAMPAWPGNPQFLSWHFAPPGQTAGTYEQVQTAFSNVCSQIEGRIAAFVGDLEQGEARNNDEVEG
jgi:arsenate reductase